MSTPVPRAPPVHSPQQYMSLVVSVPQLIEKPALYTATLVNPTTRNVGVAATPAPSMFAPIGRCDPTPLPTKSLLYVPLPLSTVGRNIPALDPPPARNITLWPPKAS